MHLRNDDAPYACTADAMCHWPETATAVAVRRSDSNHCDVLAPLGWRICFGMVIRPILRFAVHKREVYEAGVHARGWLERWPGLRCVDPA